MDKNDCYRVGRIVKSFGFKGEVLLFFENDPAASFADLPSLFVERDGELIPYFPEEFQIRDEQTVLVRFDDVTTEDEAKKLVNSDLYLPMGTLPAGSQSKRLASWIEGYNAFNHEKGFIGEVRGLIRLKEQDLLRVINQGKEMLIPAVDSYILSINKRKKEIHLDLPEGLLDLNP
ncbi:MAG: ribosome maturation factor RimM [Bacteroidales bacterium]|nr:16S rRNA processing protein RimM [Lentimicrobiaceae bacterium]MDD5694266.1 ribosome maturation factor RimM [Bacteroidales bacterium]